ncbi:MAG: bifunctional UDP-N-acetylglucosamine diphosphorylase/glucosamine-1-phosphate N-acetyltransferase GlmU [Methylophilales bacterium]|nr:bifunctional UDP-N-acetylglucosamine diphosphorylase/glucosamine-1-phosphate N-acetyltransferase GlmU [Methylophilales bacterium]
MPVTPLNIVILAAGKGTRMHSSLPKVLHPLAGTPMLTHVITTAKALKPSKLCVVYGFGGDLVVQTIADDSIIWAMQQEQKGTGHAVQQAALHLEQESITLVLFGDVPLIRVDTCERVLNEAEKNVLTLLTLNMTDPTGYGRILRNSNGAIVGIVEQKDATEKQRQISEVNTGIMAIPTRQLMAWLQRLKADNAQGEYYLTDIVAMAVADGVAVTSVAAVDSAEVFGVNSKKDLATLERAYQKQIAEQLLAQGVTLADPARIDVRGTLNCGQDVAIDVNCVFEGTVKLGNNVQVGTNSVIRNTCIGDDTKIAPFSHIDDAEIGQDCRIGPYARIRPGTRLSAKTHIGNFVEIKNSDVGFNSKINHLSYVGDSTVGKDVNIGAGTITCNYDGVNKHRTIIEDGAFIGSDTQLVAPVTVGKDATIAAGSTITKNAPAGELSLSRGKQVTIKGWKRPSKKG